MNAAGHPTWHGSGPPGPFGANRMAFTWVNSTRRSAIPLRQVILDITFSTRLGSEVVPPKGAGHRDRGKRGVGAGVGKGSFRFNRILHGNDQIGDESVDGRGI